MTENSVGTPESDAEPSNGQTEGASTRELCEAASDALSRAAAQLRETVLASDEGRAAADCVDALVAQHGPDGLLWLLGDVKLLAVARWLEHRSQLLTPAPDVCGDVLQLDDGGRVACELRAGHDGRHGCWHGSPPGAWLRWVDRSWAAPGVYAPPPSVDGEVVEVGVDHVTRRRVLGVEP